MEHRAEEAMMHDASTVEVPGPLGPYAPGFRQELGLAATAGPCSNSRGRPTRHWPAPRWRSWTSGPAIGPVCRGWAPTGSGT